MVGVPVEVQPAPAHHDLATVPVEIRDNEAAAGVLHDRTPQEHRLAREQLAEYSDALGLNGEPILQVQAVGEVVAFL